MEWRRLIDIATKSPRIALPFPFPSPFSLRGKEEERARSRNNSCVEKQEGEGESLVCVAIVRDLPKSKLRQNSSVERRPKDTVILFSFIDRRNW